MQMDRIEENLKGSGRIVRDETLDAYLRAIVCALSPEYCDQIRIYVVQAPHFNASMRPNGTMEVWTGLLVRCENEAQLAFVLAHEIAHFQRRHTVQAWVNMRRTADGLIFVQLAAGAAGLGYVGDLAQWIAAGSVLAFSRDKEREADALGFEMMARAGYDPRAAPRIWQRLMEEQRVAEDERDRQPPVFMSTHPSPNSRVDTLSEMAAGQPRGGDARDRFRSVTGPLRGEFLRDELRLRRFKRSEWLLGQLLESGAGPGELEFFKGELYRMRGQRGDEQVAIEWYVSAAERGDVPAENFRSLGLLYRRSGNAMQARQALQRYLERAPAAGDRKLIESYLAELEQAP